MSILRSVCALAVLVACSRTSAHAQTGGFDPYHASREQIAQARADFDKAWKTAQREGVVPADRHPADFDSGSTGLSDKGRALVKDGEIIALASLRTDAADWKERLENEIADLESRAVSETDPGRREALVDELGRKVDSLKETIENSREVRSELLWRSTGAGSFAGVPDLDKLLQEEEEDSELLENRQSQLKDMAGVSDSEWQTRQEGRDLDSLLQDIADRGVENLDFAGLQQAQALLKEADDQGDPMLSGMREEVDGRLKEVDSDLAAGQAEKAFNDAWSTIQDRSYDEISEDEMKDIIEKYAMMQALCGSMSTEDMIQAGITVEQGDVIIMLWGAGVLGVDEFEKFFNAARERANEVRRERDRKMKARSPKRRPPPMTYLPLGDLWQTYTTTLTESPGPRPPSSEDVERGTTTTTLTESPGPKPPSGEDVDGGSMDDEEIASLEQGYLLYLLDGTGPDAEAWRRELATALFGLSAVTDQFQAGDLGQNTGANQNGLGFDTVIDVGGTVTVTQLGGFDRWTVPFPVDQFFGQPFNDGLVRLLYPPNDPAWLTLPGNGSNANVTVTGTEISNYAPNAWTLVNPNVQIQGDGTHTAPAADVFFFE
ncbi:MAG: hypothetical protein AAB434_04825 [Planctomycetota bacterium]